MTAEDLRKSILQQAIQGKLVPQDPNDEPAAVLLERIREEKARLIKEKKIKKDKSESIIFRGDDNSYYEKILATGEVKCIDEEIPFEIPESWEWVRLTAVSIIQEGPGIRSFQYKENGVQLLTVTNILEGQVDLKKAQKYISENEYVEKYQHFQLNNGDIVCACSGGSWGKSAIYELINHKIILNTSTLRLRFYADIAFNEYLYLITKTHTFKQQLADQLSGMQPNFGYAHYSKILIPFPPLCEQIQIVKRIEQIIPWINKYQVSEEELMCLDVNLNTELKKSILQYAIQGKLVHQIDTEEPATILLEQIRAEKLRLLKEGKLKKKDIQDSVIFKDDDNRYYEKVGKVITDITEDLPFEIPESWQWSRLSNIANLYTGNSINEAEKNTRYTNVQGTEYIATKDVKFDNSIDYQNGVAIPNQYVANFRIAPAKSVLMCIEGGSAGRKIGILDQEVCFGNKLCCFAPYTDISEYIFYYLQSPLFFEIFSSNKNGIIGGVSVNNLKQLFIPLPPLNEINRIVNKIKAISKSIEG